MPSPQNHAFYRNVDLNEVQSDIENSMVKCTWDENKSQISNSQRDGKLPNSAPTQAELSCPSMLSFKNIDPSFWKNNKRINIPEPTNPVNEVERKFLREELMKVAQKYKSEECDLNGKPKLSNLSNVDELTLKNLKKKVEDNNLAVYQTDKTDKLAIDTLSNLEEKMQAHVLNDKIVPECEYNKIQRNINKHTRSWISFLNVGVNQPKKTSMNLITEDNPAPILRGTAKDHKMYDDPQKGPKMRPIMGARIGPNTGLAQIGSLITRGIKNNLPNKYEIRNTEEILQKFKAYNENLNSSTNPKKVLGSMDIEQFYPSLDPKRVAQVVRMLWSECSLLIEDVDYKKLAEYLGKYMKNEDIISENIEDFVFRKKQKNQ